MGERYEQVGWLHDEGRMFVSGIKALPEGQPQPEGWRPVYVKVPVDPVAPIMQELERCPTCGSGDRKRQWSPCKWRQEADADPWHTTAGPGVSADTDR